MGAVKLALGAELDLVSGDELADGLDGLESRLLGGGKRARPLYNTFPQSAPGAGGLLTLTIGAPPAGRIWNVLAATVVGNDDHGSVPSPVGYFAMYFGDPANVSLGQLAAVKLALPSTTLFSANALWCPAGQQVFFVSDKAVNTPDSCTVVISVAEWRSGELEQLTGR